MSAHDSAQAFSYFSPACSLHPPPHTIDPHLDPSLLSDEQAATSTPSESDYDSDFDIPTESAAAAAEQQQSETVTNLNKLHSIDLEIDMQLGWMQSGHSYEFKHEVLLSAKLKLDDALDDLKSASLKLTSLRIRDARNRRTADAMETRVGGNIPQKVWLYFMWMHQKEEVEYAEHQRRVAFLQRVVERRKMGLSRLMSVGGMGPFAGDGHAGSMCRGG
ncbi:hypothetical protein BDZ91DRAFT_764190 [Kalaharituber pfeilii]|nr:hypothetical protein BDZ91DRAFT_764190 [Kalaharituber pfeilii]